VTGAEATANGCAYEIISQAELGYILDYFQAFWHIRTPRTPEKQGLQAILRT
jgi:hypothetical protein